MICGISIAAPLKKAYLSNSMQVSPSKAVMNLPIDPKETGMDALVIQPKDLALFTAKTLVSAINQRHPDTQVIYIYSKKSDADKLSGVDKYFIEKLTQDNLKEAVDKSMSGRMVTAKNIAIASNDKRVLEGNSGDSKRTRAVQNLKRNVATIEEDEAKEEDYEDNEINLDSEELDDELGDSPISLDKETKDVENVKNLFKESVIPRTSPIETETQFTTQPGKALSVEDRINNITEFNDWGVLKQALDLEKLKVDLMNESSQYAGCINYMSILEQRVSTVFKDETISAEDKMLKIREIGIDKSGIKAQSNNILVDKYQKVLDAVTNLICREMDKQIAQIKVNLNKVVVKQDFFTREDDVRGVIDKRIEIRIAIAELMKGIIQTYQVMNTTSQDIISSMDENLPTESKYVNEIMKPYEGYFKPENASKLFMEITRAVEEKRLVLSSVENKLESLFQAVFKLLELDETILDNYANKFDIFKAQNTEEVIVMTTMLKSAVRLYIGPKDVGLTTTALTMSGCLARRRNTVLLDLRYVNKLQNYKVPTIDIEEFLTKNIEQDLVICYEAVSDVDRLEEILRRLNDKLYYYHNINIILDDSQVDFVERLSSELRTIIYVTNCTPKALRETKELVSKIKLSNVAHKIVEIAPPIDEIQIALDLGIDVTRCQVTSIPYMLEVAKCTAEGEVPYYKSEIRAIYEKGLRI